MGLINLQTNLKSLRFGNDRFDNGNSGQPYIQTPIPGQLPRSGTEDFILRGGLNTFEDSATDVLRLGKYFADLRNPDGLLFIAKQNLLSRTAVRTQASTGILNEGIYTPLSTLAQAGLVAFGGHLNKQGLNPTLGIGEAYTPQRYFDAVRETNFADTPLFTNISIQGVGNQNFSPLNIPLGDAIGDIRNKLIGYYQDLIIDNSSNRQDVLSYQGGPGAFLGIGKTNIRFATGNDDSPNSARTGRNGALKDTGFFTLDGTNYKVFSLGNSNTDRSDLPTFETESKLDIPQQYQDLSNLYTNYSVFKIGNSDTDRSDFISLNYNRGLGLSFLIIDKDSDKSLSDSQYTGFNQAGQLLSETEARDARPSEPSKVLISPPSSSKLINVNGLKLLGASNKFFTPITPADNGFTPNGTIDSNTRVVGSLNNPDETQSESPLNAGNNRTYTYSQADLVNIPRSSDGVDGISFYIGNVLTTTGIGDFRKKLRNNATSTQNTNNSIVGNITNAPNYFEKNIEQRVNLGNPGDTNGKDLKSYTNGSNPGKIFGYSGGNASPSSYDKINALPIYKSSESAPDYTNDLVKFRIGIIDNNDPSLKTYIHFRAFLNQISDGYTADWSDSRYIGRGEKFYTYSGFDRKVSLSWTVAAQSKAELIPMYKKLNYLASVCAPDYSEYGYLRGNIITLTIGGYFYEQPGIITGFNYEMNDDNATWEIGINDEGESDSTVKELPHLIKVSGFNFIPIHTFVPRLQRNLYNPEGGVLTDSNQYGPERYISLENKGAFNGPASDTNNYGEIYRTPNPSPPPPPPTPPPPSPTPTPQQQQALFGIQDVSGAGGSAQQTVSPPGGNPFVEPLVNEGNTGVATVPDAVIELRRQQLTR